MCLLELILLTGRVHSFGCKLTGSFIGSCSELGDLQSERWQLLFVCIVCVSCVCVRLVWRDGFVLGPVLMCVRWPTEGDGCWRCLWGSNHRDVLESECRVCGPEMHVMCLHDVYMDVV